MLATLLLAHASALGASPIYLSCEVLENETPTTIALTIDEAGQRVTIHQEDTGRAVSRDAVFSPSDVKVPDDESIWFIDRETLGIKRLVTIGKEQWEDRGQCKIAETPQGRAF